MDGIKRLRLEPRTYQERRTFPQKRSKGESGSNKRRSQHSNSLILDNGAYSIKIGYSSHEEPTNLPNHIMKAKSERKRCFIADQIEDCRDLSGLFYIMPHERGYLTKFDVQKTVWDYTFNKFPIVDSNVVITQPINNFKHIQEYMDEIFFEEYDVKSMLRASSTDFTQYQYVNSIKNGVDTPCLVVDSGYSFTHIIPYINGKKYTEASIRLDIGGKLLTNYLKDIISYRQLHVMEETYVINQVKEDTCYVASDFNAEMDRAKATNEIVQNYVLPDFHNIRRGYVNTNSTDQALTENCQILKLNNERISIPEILIYPSMIPGLEQAGIPQCISNAISRCPERYRKAMADNIILTGGNCLYPGFKERMESETRKFLPDHHRMTIYQPKNAVNYAWLGGRAISQDPKFNSYCVTKQEYEEYGSSLTYKKFNTTAIVEKDPPKKPEEKPFSYLEYWAKEGVDIFQKAAEPPTPPEEPDFQIMIEGEGIEEYDGKFLTIEFDFEDNSPKPQETIVKPPEEVITINDDGPEELPIPQFKFLKRRRPIHKLEPATSTSMADFPINGIQMPSNSTPTLGQTFIDLRVTKPPAKVYKPIFKTKTDTKIIDPKRTQFLKISGNSMTIKGNSILVPNTGAMKTVVGGRHVLNNTVLLPQNLLSKNVLSLQLIPFRPQLLKQEEVPGLTLIRRCCMYSQLPVFISISLSILLLGILWFSVY